ncbi:MAG: FkbM family methyltransferase [Flavobacteriales bacterium]|nr:FkbM family methyltransferase [Flavobacteriales bacterium]MCB9365439.1 FkbM family methyltransferase [Flavobacteriales bacterium]
MKKLLLYYLRNFPLEMGKKRLSTFIKIPNNTQDFVFTNSTGLKFHINLSEYVMKQIYMFDIYEKPYVRYLSSFPNNQIKKIIDIGANIGNYTLALKHAYPDSEIHSFEPNSTNHLRLTKNIELNGFKNIHVNKVGLSDKKGELKLFFDEKNMGAATLAENVGSKHETILLETLDNYCVQNNITNIDLLKIDIEGGEINCLKGAVDILEKTTKGIIQLEVDYGHCKRLGYSAKELFDFPMQYGYKPHLLNKWGKILAVSAIPEKFIGNVIYLKGY